MEEYRKYLSYDRDFFEKKKEEFLKSVLKNLENLNISPNNIKKYFEKFYECIFLSDKDLNEIVPIIDRVLEIDLSLKRLFIKPLISLLYEYIEYVFKTSEDINRVRAIFLVIDKILQIVESVYQEKIKEVQKHIQAKYTIEVEKLKKKISQEEKEFIYHLLDRIRTRKERVEIKKYYKEIPLFCRCKVVECDSLLDLIVLDCPHCRFKIFFQRTALVYLKHPDFPKPVAGIVLRGDYNEGTLALTGLHFEELPQDKRRWIRVEPKEPTEVKVTKDGRQYTGLLKDISEHGLGVIFKKLPPLEIGNFVEIKTTVENLLIQTTAEVRNIDPSINKVGFYFDLPYEIEKQLSQYILRRQLEILKEVKE
jgi:hypothetical protein